LLIDVKTVHENRAINFVHFIVSVRSSSERELKFYGFGCVLDSASPFMPVLKEAATRLLGFVSLSVQLQPAGVKVRKSRGTMPGYIEASVV